MNDNIKKIIIEPEKQKSQQSKTKKINFEKEIKLRVETKSWGLNEEDLLHKTQLNSLIKYINKNIKIEQLLKKEKKEKINNLLKIKNIRGIRQSLGLPVNGQRTHTNAKTCKKLKLQV